MNAPAKLLGFLAVLGCDRADQALVAAYTIGVRR
jgi:hypothetical protein